MTVDNDAEAQAAPVCYRHPQRESWIRCTRCDRPICPDCMRDAAVGFQCPECVGEANRRTRQARTVYGGAVRDRAGQVTIALIAINVVAFALKYLAGANQVDARFALFELVRLPDGSIGGVAQGEYYRMVTAMFLHVGLLHIALNMYLLWLMGPALEHLLGRLRFGALYFGAGLGGSALSYLTGQGGEGASGAIFGLFAAYWVLTRRLGWDTSQITVLIGINLVLSFVLPGIGYWAHLGGLAGGAVIGAAYAYAPKGPIHPWVQAGGVAVVFAAVAVITGYHTAALT